MIKLLIVADDFTGALDTGIQFAEYGAGTKLMAASELNSSIFYEPDTEVLVIDAETRHLTSERAYQIVYYLVRQAREEGVPYIYKKTDSGLRGNIGSELKAVLEAAEEEFLPYIPALPEMNRITKNGIHYVNQIPIAKTEFGRDPFEPVESSRVRDLFVKEDIPVCNFSMEEKWNTDFRRGTIGIFDSSTREDIRRIALYLKERGQLGVMAGCAGFASVLPEVLGIRKKQVKFPVLRQQLLIACGSMNPITRRQIEYGEKLGYRRVIMTPRQQLEEGYLESAEGRKWLEEIDRYFEKSNVVMIDTGAFGKEKADEYRRQHGISMEQARVRVARRIGNVLKKLLEKNDERTLMIIGGDTLMGFVSQTGCRKIIPVCEVEPGTVLSAMEIDGKRVWVITKSGGFGNRELFQTVVKRMEV